MSLGASSGPIHPVPTGKSQYPYLFSDKHHGRDAVDAAEWIVSRDEEFRVFDIADEQDLRGDRDWLYGVGERNAEGQIPDRGTWGQQIAEFPLARSNEPWHGYPLWPLNEQGPQNRSGEKCRPSK